MKESVLNSSVVLAVIAIFIAVVNVINLARWKYEQEKRAEETLQKSLREKTVRDIEAEVEKLSNEILEMNMTEWSCDIEDVSIMYAVHKFWLRISEIDSRLEERKNGDDKGGRI